MIKTSSVNRKSNHSGFAHSSETHHTRHHHTLNQRKTLLTRKIFNAARSGSSEDFKQAIYALHYSGENFYEAGHFNVYRLLHLIVKNISTDNVEELELMIQMGIFSIDNFFNIIDDPSKFAYKQQFIKTLTLMFKKGKYGALEVIGRNCDKTLKNDLEWYAPNIHLLQESCNLISTSECIMRYSLTYNGIAINYGNYNRVFNDILLNFRNRISTELWICESLTDKKIFSKMHDLRNKLISSSESLLAEMREVDSFAVQTQTSRKKEVSERVSQIMTDLSLAEKGDEIFKNFQDVITKLNHILKSELFHYRNLLKRIDVELGREQSNFSDGIHIKQNFSLVEERIIAILRSVRSFKTHHHYNYINELLSNVTIFDENYNLFKLDYDASQSSEFVPEISVSELKLFELASNRSYDELSDLLDTLKPNPSLRNPKNSDTVLRAVARNHDVLLKLFKKLLGSPWFPCDKIASTDGDSILDIVVENKRVDLIRAMESCYDLYAKSLFIKLDEAMHEDFWLTKDIISNSRDELSQEIKDRLQDNAGIDNFICWMQNVGGFSMKIDRLQYHHLNELTIGLSDPTIHPLRDIIAYRNKLALSMIHIIQSALTTERQLLDMKRSLKDKLVSRSEKIDDFDDIAVIINDYIEERSLKIEKMNIFLKASYLKIDNAMNEICKFFENNYLDGGLRGEIVDYEADLTYEVLECWEIEGYCRGKNIYFLTENSRLDFYTFDDFLHNTNDSHTDFTRYLLYKEQSEQLRKYYQDLGDMDLITTNLAQRVQSFIEKLTKETILDKMLITLSNLPEYLGCLKIKNIATNVNRISRDLGSMQGIIAEENLDLVQTVGEGSPAPLKTAPVLAETSGAAKSQSFLSSLTSWVWDKVNSCRGLITEFVARKDKIATFQPRVMNPHGKSSQSRIYYSQNETRNNLIDGCAYNNGPRYISAQTTQSGENNFGFSTIDYKNICINDNLLLVQSLLFTVFGLKLCSDVKSAQTSTDLLIKEVEKAISNPLFGDPDQDINLSVDQNQTPWWKESSQACIITKVVGTGNPDGCLDQVEITNFCGEKSCRGL